ncbi:serine/threonine-protein kinase [Paeniglutamicibacter cryotolerans]|uniref:non-specific serine/threonine protein kinase n=1 Tax=Paeniglutamicibacter cryotolerans TaxID=670079 RepID=A0A839QZH5_9MICC|nr:serine/threonine-protein kinase [Paeniglutamicibacter cryotolerans]MBB2997371.1 serine/threonine-protein kinase [Paeniglutamicibacter cryotolerans]
MSRALGSKYTLGESLGRGAMGEAFRGTDHQGNKLAFKLLHAELARDPELVERFVRERSILLALRGENLVQVRDLVIEGDTLAIVMDLVSGGDLRAAITRQGSFTPGEVCRLGAGIARGLETVHGTGIIHRDIKPANILLGGSEGAPVPQLSDFGISSLIDDAHMRSTTVVGTPQYIAPEVAAGHSAVPASDLYALGIVLYELSVGVTPFAGGSVMAVLLRHGTTLAARPEGIPDPLWNLICLLLAKEPAQRPADARTTAEALEALRGQLAGLPAAPRLAHPLDPVPLSGVTPTGAVAMPAAASGPGVALAPPPPESSASSPVPTSFLPPNPPGPGLVKAYASIAEPADSMDGSGAATTVRGGLKPPVQGIAPVAHTANQTAEPGSRTALFVVLALVLAIVLAGAGILFWYLNGNREAPGTEVASGATPAAAPTTLPQPSDDATPSAAPSAAVTAPDLKGKTEAEARALLPAGIKLSITQTTSLDVPAGQISAQDPESGQPLGDSMELTVEFGLTPDSPAAAPLPVPVQGAWLSIDGADLRGQSHNTVLGAPICATDAPQSGKIVYDLDGKYSSFSATVALVDAAHDGGTEAHIDAVVDGNVYDSATINDISFREWDIDLVGAKKLEFDWERGQCGGTSSVLGMGSPVFVPSDQ